VAAILAWSAEDIRVKKPGDRFPLGGYEIAFNGVIPIRESNYVASRGDFTAFKDGVEVARIFPEKRVYTETDPPTPTTEAGIDYGFYRDIYIVLGDPQAGDAGAWAVRSYVKPYANWIWGGAIVMALGGVLSLTDRRYRVGAAKMATAPRGPAVGVPAE
jgi:cytochrome c-type biogenesis protein CcmF